MISSAYLRGKAWRYKHSSSLGHYSLSYVYKYSCEFSVVVNYDLCLLFSTFRVAMREIGPPLTIVYRLGGYQWSELPRVSSGHGLETARSLAPVLSAFCHTFTWKFHFEFCSKFHQGFFSFRMSQNSIRQFPWCTARFQNSKRTQKPHYSHITWSACVQTPDIWAKREAHSLEKSDNFFEPF